MMNCPKCSGVMEEKKGQYGRFLGCTKFPRCRHTERVKKIGKDSDKMKVSRIITKRRRTEQQEQKRLAKEANKRI